MSGKRAEYTKKTFANSADADDRTAILVGGQNLHCFRERTVVVIVVEPGQKFLPVIADQLRIGRPDMLDGS